MRRLLYPRSREPTIQDSQQLNRSCKKMQKTIHFSILIRDRDYQDSRKIDNKCYFGIYSYIAVDNNKWLALIRSLLVTENLGIWKFALKFNFQLVAFFFFLSA